MSQEPNNNRNKALEEILSQYTEGEIESAIRNLAASGNEFAKKIIVSNELDSFEKHVAKDIPDEYTKAILRGKIKENAEFIGTVRNEAACNRYAAIAKLAEGFEFSVKNHEGKIEIIYSEPHPTSRSASVAIDFPTVYSMNRASSKFISAMMSHADRVVIAECWSDDPAEAGTLGTRITFRVNDTWS